MTTRITYRDGSTVDVDLLPVAFMDLEDELGENVLVAFRSKLKVYYQVLHRSLVLQGDETREFREWIEACKSFDDDIDDEVGADPTGGETTPSPDVSPS